MNREIKFRAWCESNKEMYFPDENYEFWVDNNSIGFYPRYDVDELYHFNTIPAEHEKGIIIMQFTGLKDKNGVDIYEGDVHRDPDGAIICCVWDNNCARFAWVEMEDGEVVCGSIDEMDELTEAEETEVIGNIYSNPELIKQ